MSSVRTKLATIKLPREKFPRLVRLFDSDKQQYADLIRPLIQLAEVAVEKDYDQASKQYFKKSFGEVAKELIEAFYDMEEIMDLHAGDKYSKELGSIYGLQLHPLHAALVGKLRDREGNLVTTELKFGLPQSEFNIKHWIHTLLFYSHYSDLEKLSRALSLRNMDIEDELKKEQFERLLPIQPVLEMQERQGIQVGLLVAKTGLFDVGLTAEEVNEICPACQRHGTIYETDYVKGCKYCSAGFLKQKGEYQL